MIKIIRKADLLRQCLGNRRSRSVTAVLRALQEPICYSSVWGTAGADLLRQCLGNRRSRSVTAGDGDDGDDGVGREIEGRK